ncbi:MAG: preprotein translocase subunit SecG [Bacteroidia bacterium]|nr:preprotein translocase subunit SecG [Bacteroidia bacterium]MDW8301525.1 preprotein translocase subunit SecG [Bacteroidia bacterium]
MFQFLAILIMIIAVLLILVVLMQSSKGGGLTGSFGSATAAQIIGVRKTVDFLEKASWTLIAAFLVLCIAANLVLLSSKGKPTYKSKIGKAATTTTTPANNNTSNTNNKK